MTRLKGSGKPWRSSPHAWSFSSPLKVLGPSTVAVRSLGRNSKSRRAGLRASLAANFASAASFPKTGSNGTQRIQDTDIHPYRSGHPLVRQMRIRSLLEMKILLGWWRQGFFYKLPALVTEHCCDQFPRRPRRISPGGRNCNHAVLTASGIERKESCVPFDQLSPFFKRSGPNLDEPALGRDFCD
jgi:hypothetical protein